MRLMKGLAIILVSFNLVRGDEFVLEADKLPDETEMPSLANGLVGFTVYGDSIFLNGLYNGPHGNSHRARIPNYSNLQFSLCNRENFESCTFRMDFKRGLFETKFNNRQFEVIQHTYAHRYYNRAIINRIVIDRLTSDTDINVKLVLNEGEISTDLFTERSNDNNMDGKTVKSIFYTTRVVEDIQYQYAPSKAYIAYTVPPPTLELKASETTLEHTHVFVASLDENEVSKEMLAVLQSKNLLGTHEAEWTDFWNNFEISVEGDDNLNEVLHASVFYLSTNLPSLNTYQKNPPFFGISPSGLAKGGFDEYQGHNFWDTEIWMLPSIILMEPRWGRELLSYRYMIRKAVRDNALNHGYEGYKYPWEAAFTGTETTAYCCLEVAEFQHHITASIAFGLRNYMLATADIDWFMNEGCHIAYNTAKFWASRVSLDNTTKSYDINHVMGPDEDHWDVNNNAYTNVIAAMNLNFGEFASCLCNKTLNVSKVEAEGFAKIARKINLIYDQKNDYHPQHEGYKLGTTIKQADAVLLGYPLQYKMKESTKRNNLMFYENVTRTSGPAMTWAIHTIGFLDLRNYTEAEKLFTRSYSDYIRGPFKTWYEVTHGKFGAQNFMTGAGGFLQAIINGYAGIRLHFNHINITNFALPPKTTKLTIKGFSFMNNRINLNITEKSATVDRHTSNEQTPIDISPDSTGAIVTIRPKTLNHFGSCRLRETVLNSSSSIHNFQMILVLISTIFLHLKL